MSDFPGYSRRETEISAATRTGGVPDFSYPWPFLTSTMVKLYTFRYPLDRIPIDQRRVGIRHSVTFRHGIRLRPEFVSVINDIPRPRFPHAPLLSRRHAIACCSDVDTERGPLLFYLNREPTTVVGVRELCKRYRVTGILGPRLRETRRFITDPC